DITSPVGMSRSVGRPNAGRLENGVPVRSFPGAIVVNPDQCWATDETAALLVVAIEETRRAFPDAHDLVLGDISHRDGGPIAPHRSHQSGRDVDLGFYYLGKPPGRMFIPATPANFDVERTWYLIETMLLTERVQYIFIDNAVQRMLYEHVRGIYPPKRLEAWFQYPRGPRAKAIIRHVPGHRDHIHVRFKCSEGDAGCEE
ncbi:MAG: penicillin-insensitive murein endopeptidase, partial [Deltaproteobacteria bacterium]|nr:penicillin-insensitive murein endopeptidase [Deltaproteobacteria bacterium]